MINIRTQIIIAIFIIIALYIIVNMIRKRQLELKYALAWLMVGIGIGILVLDIFPNSMIWLADVLGIAQPINMLFFVGFCFALCIIFGLTVAISKMSVRIKELAQELALYKKLNEEESNSECKR